MDKEVLIRFALSARTFAYAPSSGFLVGAALLARNGKVYTGCNIENAAYSPTNCAERTAFFKAVSEGEREFAAIAIVGGYAEEEKELPEYCPPCGVCRQVMAEFCNDDFIVILAKNETDFITYTLGELLPAAFRPGNLERGSNGEAQ